jgi:hypothetical protein
MRLTRRHAFPRQNRCRAPGCLVRAPDQIRFRIIVTREPVGDFGVVSQALVGSSRIKYNCCRERRDVEATTNTRLYFANPYHSWERGTNENTNGLVRQYIPKGTCMKDLTQAQCHRIAKKLNTRPRKRHGFKTPEEILYG